MEPQGTANNRTKLNSTPAQAPASAPLPHIPTHAPAPQLPPNRPFHTDAHTEQGEESEGRASSDEKDQHLTPLTEQLQSRSVYIKSILLTKAENRW